MKKGQVAFEFLMTYGWAIIVVLVVVGALAYFGVLSPLFNPCNIYPQIQAHIIRLAINNLWMLRKKTHPCLFLII